MDREQEDMQFMGLFDIYFESYKIIYKWRKILSQITLTLILPLSFIFLAHLEISSYLSYRLRHTKFMLYRAGNDAQRHYISDLISWEKAIIWIFRLVYFTFLMVFSLLSTSAVVYTVACIYSSKEITFKKVMSVVPRVWKRLMITFLCTFLAFFAYNMVSFTIIFTITFGLIGDNLASVIILYIFLVFYIVGFIYMTIIWQLASVVTVLEDSYGIKAMMKSKDLIKGKMVASIAIFFKLNFALVVINIVFRLYVVHGWRLGWLPRFGFGILCLLLLFKLILFGLVIQTVIYFVCKSYHHENIDKSALSDHLEAYMGDYVPLMSKDVQLEEYQA